MPSVSGNTALTKLPPNQYSGNDAQEIVPAWIAYELAFAPMALRLDSRTLSDRASDSSQKVSRRKSVRRSPLKRLPIGICRTHRPEPTGRGRALRTMHFALLAVSEVDVNNLDLQKASIILQYLKC